MIPGWNGVCTTCLKFGGKASSHEFEGPSAAFTDIAKAEGLGDYCHWVDDLMSAQAPIPNVTPFTYAYSTDDVVKLGKELGITFPANKIQPFAAQTRYVGFDWFWDLKEVRIPEEKRKSVLELVTTCTTVGRISLDDLHSLCGKLAHLSMVVPEGRSMTRALWSRLAKMVKSCRSGKITWAWGPAQIADLAWWGNTLKVPNVGMNLCTEPSPDDCISLYCDASTSWGIGIVINNRFDRFKLRPGWDVCPSGTRRIGWAEFAAVEVLIHCLKSFLGKDKFKNRHFLLYSDNQTVIGGWLKRSSKNVEQNAVLNRVLRVLLKNQSFLTIRYVESSKNPADGPSRGLDLPGSTRTRFSPLPKELSELMTRDGP